MCSFGQGGIWNLPFCPRISFLTGKLAQKCNHMKWKISPCSIDAPPVLNHWTMDAPPVVNHHMDVHRTTCRNSRTESVQKMWTAWSWSPTSSWDNTLLISLTVSFKGVSIIYCDVFESAMDIIKNHQLYCMQQQSQLFHFNSESTKRLSFLSK